MKDINRSANPNRAEIEWDRFCSAYGKIPLTSGLGFSRLFGNSRFLANFLIRFPKVADDLLEDKALVEKSFPNYQRETKKITDFQALRFYKYKQLLRITLRDLANQSTASVCRELSSLAYAVLMRVNTLVSLAPPKHHILAMGKLGGWELNYSSDIDLLVIAKNDLGLDQLAQHTQKLSQVLQDRTDMGFFYRTDWDLRPGGKDGVLVHSISALEAYYEKSGEDWERQAFTKASLGAGDPTVGKTFLKRMEPFIYRKNFDLESINHIHQMKQKIMAELKTSSDGWNIKLGAGGIREIEFFVQSFVMIYAGRHVTLRITNTLEQLSELIRLKLLDKQEAGPLATAYLFLRKLENSLQMEDEAQTHTLLRTPDEQRKVARRMGYEEPENEAALAHFQKDLLHHTDLVQERFTHLFSEKPTSIPIDKDLQQSLKETDFEGQLNTLRIYRSKKLEEIKKSEDQTSRQNILGKLSGLAETLTEEALSVAIKSLHPIYGTPLYVDSRGLRQESHLIVVGMGKFGGMEINYTSDLDLIFIFSEQGETSGPKIISNTEYFSKLVQKLIFILGVSTNFGFCYQVDAEVRPSGNAGPLVTSLESFLVYQRKVSQIWEIQSLIRARPITGTEALLRLARQHLQALVYHTPHPKGIRREMHRLRMRVERELAKESKNLIHIKLGCGGIMDIEFLLQFHQLCYGNQHPELRKQNTFEALSALNEIGMISKGAYLVSAYDFLRTLESKIVLQTGRHLGRIDVRSDIFEKAATAMELRPKGLIEKYGDTRNQIRIIYNELFS